MAPEANFSLAVGGLPRGGKGSSLRKERPSTEPHRVVRLSIFSYRRKMKKSLKIEDVHHHRRAGYGIAALHLRQAGEDGDFIAGVGDHDHHRIALQGLAALDEAFDRDAVVA